MPDVPYWHVDAFAAQPFAGNQAAVMVLDEWLPDAMLQAIGAENMFAETAFLVRAEQDDTGWELRWFTPAAEVAMCGHATLASGHVLLQRDGGERIRFATRKAGVLEVVRGTDGLELSLPGTLVEARDDRALLDALRVEGSVHHSVSGAEQTAVIELADEGAVRAAAPDMALLSKIEVMAIVTARGEDADIVSRVFVPAWGIDEDSVTGSAHAALGPFWAAKLERDRFTAHQASARGGDLIVRVEDERVWLGGPCVTVVKGRFRLP